uniref:Uncharacterized protein n=1 Tax=Moniliophthora roreri TaxID=221103 RepID=A0A0W0EZB3_MONRR
MFSPSLKRKRDEYDENADSDDEEPSFGRQILPVANLPGDFDGIPQDGMEYLFTVRRDAAKLPHVTRVANPYATAEPILSAARNIISTSSALPSEEWREVIQGRFHNLKKNMMQPTIYIAMPEASNPKVMPDIQERTLWWEFLAGKPDSEWNPPKKPKPSNKQRKLGRGMRAFPIEENKSDAEIPQPPVTADTTHDGPSQTDPSHETPSEAGPSMPFVVQQPTLKPRKPTPHMLKLLDERQSLHLLKYFTHWINVHLQGHPSDATLPRLRQTHAQWIFALLTRIGDFVSADDMNLLRNLTRACFSLLKVIINEKKGNTSILQDTLPDGEAEMDQKSCWVIITVIVEIWHQRDLWMDAEDMLKSIDMAGTQ